MIGDGGNFGRRVTAVASTIASYSGDPGGALSSFSTCIEALERSTWPDVAWQFSGLMRGGPVEFVFSSSDNALRYTVEAAGPELPDQLRLDAVRALMERLGQKPPPPQLMRVWRDLQAGSSLSWGAWLGVRRDRTAEKAKIYIEVPRGNRSRIATAFPPLPGSLLRLIGYEPARERTEFYFSKTPAERCDLEALMRLVKQADRRQALLVGFSEFCGMPIDSALRWIVLGYSLAFDAEGERPQVALFVRADAVLGGASSVRRRLLEWQSRSGLQSSAYRKLMTPLTDRDLPDHGIVTLGLGLDGEVEVRVGVSGVALAERCCEWDEGQGHPVHTQEAVRP